MPYSSVVISSGHGKYIRGASGNPGLDEVNEARLVVESVAGMLRDRGVSVKSFHDNTSHDQSTNLTTIVNYHNAQSRQLDVSVHFNAYQQTNNPMGVEVLYITQQTLADQLAARIANQCGFLDRGPKKRTDLYFLNNTTKPAILIETCFCDSTADAETYRNRFERCCDAIADLIGREDAGIDPVPPDWRPPVVPPPEQAPVHVIGRVSQFGGPNDTGVAPDEGLAFIQSVDQFPWLFLPTQPPDTTGLARRLNPVTPYFAVRWDYNETPKNTLLQHRGLIRNRKTGFAVEAFPGDWGPHADTGRVADVSPAIMVHLGLKTDDEVEVTWPVEGDV
jgi:N-acetylmuramoyl-L-alanine amidase